MAAVDAGVDIQDPAALNAFMVGFNLRQAARNGFGDAARPQWGASPAPSKAKRPPPPANPYDPCPCGSGKKYKFCCKENSAS